MQSLRQTRNRSNGIVHVSDNPADCEPEAECAPPASGCRIEPPGESSNQKVNNRGCDEPPTARDHRPGARRQLSDRHGFVRSEEHTSELQSLRHPVCRLLLEKKKN